MITLKDFADLDPDLVAQHFASIVQRVQDDAPKVDAGRGVWGDILSWYGALQGAQFEGAALDYEVGRSLLDIEANPNAVPPEAVDQTLSNYSVTRLPGRKTTGTALVVVAGDTPVLIGAGAVWESAGARFVTTQAWTAKPADTGLDPATDLELAQAGAGRFAFELPLEAEFEGPVGVRRGALVVPQVVPPGYVESTAASDFVTGFDPETNAEMLEHLAEGRAAKTPSNRTCVRAMIRAEPAFERVVRFSVVGLGNPEMHRDRYWVFPVSGGGRVDVYARTAETPERRRLTLTAVRTGTHADGSAVMQLSLTRDAFPGYYEVASVRPEGAEDDVDSLPLSTEARSLDLTGGGYVPDVRGLAHGGYSRYQAAVVQFYDDTASAPAEAGGTADYAVDLIGMPQVGELQDYLSAEARNGTLSDTLVRAPVPCFVQVALTVYRPANGQAVDEAAVRSAAAATVNAAPFVGRLYGSAILDRVYNVLPSDARVAGLDVLGRLRYPDGQTKYLRSPELLEVDDDPEACVTARTVQFFCWPEDVAVTVAAAPANPE